MTYTIVGKKLPRKEALGKVVGETKYGGDFCPKGVLTARLLVSPIPHARIVSIDTSRAERLPGVRAVLTSRDCPPVNLGRTVKDRPILARGKVRYAGEPVAAVAAEAEDIAEEALSLITVEYEEVPAVFDPLQAMEEGSALVHEDLPSYKFLPMKRKIPTNILNEKHWKAGDLEAGFREADLIYEDAYTTQPVHQGYIERREVVVSIDSSGKVTFWSTTKAPHEVRADICEALDLPFNKVRVIATAVGGDFGGKGTIYLEPIAYILSMKTGRPIRLSLSRREEFTSAFCRPSSIIHLKVGARKDGSLVAFQGRIVYESGAYCDAAGFANEPGAHLFPSYRVPNLQIDGYVLYTNNPPRGHVRGPGGPQPFFALESHFDMVAHKLGLDPLEFRLKNCLRDGDHLPQGLILKNSGLVKCLETAREYIEKKRGSAKPNQGWGLAVSEWSVGKVNLNAALAWVRVVEDGTAVLGTGITEQGGGQYSIFSQIVAEVLGIPYEAVSVVAGDTDTTPFERGASGSQVTWRLGTAVRLAAEEAREQLLDIAAEKLETTPETLALGDGKVYLKDTPEVSISIAELASASLNSRGVPIFGTGRRQREAMVAATRARAHITDRPCFGVHAVHIEADPDTGQIKLLDYLACHDIGFAINPQNVEGQIHGGTSCGVGYGLMEEVKLEEGQTLNPSLSDYRLPTAADMPHINTHLVEVPSEYGPFGAKGIGEPPTLAPAPAIANALYNALGVRIKDLPLTPEKVFRALREKKKEAG